MGTKKTAQIQKNTKHFNILRPNKKISVLRVTGLKILGRITAHIFLFIFFLEKNIILYILKGILRFERPQNLFHDPNTFPVFQGSPKSYT